MMSDDRSAPVYQIPAYECLCDGCQTNERRWGKRDLTPLTRHDMNFWSSLVSQQQLPEKLFRLHLPIIIEIKEFACVEVALRVGKSRSGRAGGPKLHIVGLLVTSTDVIALFLQRSATYRLPIKFANSTSPA